MKMTSICSIITEKEKWKFILFEASSNCKWDMLLCIFLPSCNHSSSIMSQLRLIFHCLIYSIWDLFLCRKSTYIHYNILKLLYFWFEYSTVYNKIQAIVVYQIMISTVLQFQWCILQTENQFELRWRKLSGYQNISHV